MKKRKQHREVNLYRYVAKWLGDQGYKSGVLISPNIPSIPTGARLGIQTISPDIVGYKKDSHKEVLTLIEVKAVPMHLVEGIGRCKIYKLIADYVYLAMPEETARRIGSNSLYELWGIGLLSVSDKGIVKEKIKAKQSIRPESEYELRMLVLKNIKSALEIK